jgi:hypothetical protein
MKRFASNTTVRKKFLQSAMKSFSKRVGEKIVDIAKRKALQAVCGKIGERVIDQVSSANDVNIGVKDLDPNGVSDINAEEIWTVKIPN